MANFVRNSACSSGEHRLSFTRDGPIVARMKELISDLVSKADLSEAQAAKVADVVREFVASRLPDALRGPVESALTGANVSSAVDQAKGLVGKLF